MSEQATRRGVKQVIVINRGTNPPMRAGKSCAQTAHASIAFLSRRLSKHGYRHSLQQNSSWEPNTRIYISDAEHQWLAGGFRKVVCRAESEDELRDLHTSALAAQLTAYLITDSGLTEFRGIPTVTALAIGPDYDDLIDPITRHLQLY